MYMMYMDVPGTSNMLSRFVPYQEACWEQNILGIMGLRIFSGMTMGLKVIITASEILC